MLLDSSAQQQGTGRCLQGQCDRPGIAHLWPGSPLEPTPLGSSSALLRVAGSEVRFDDSSRRKKNANGLTCFLPLANSLYRPQPMGTGSSRISHPYAVPLCVPAGTRRGRTSRASSPRGGGTVLTVPAPQPPGAAVPEQRVTQQHTQTSALPPLPAAGTLRGDTPLQ